MNATSKSSVLYREIGERVRAARGRAKVSQEQLATNVGLSRTSVTNLETGRQQVPLHVLYRIADALGVRIIDLLPAVAPASEQPYNSIGDDDVERWTRQLVTSSGARTKAR